MNTMQLLEIKMQRRQTEENLGYEALLRDFLRLRQKPSKKEIVKYQSVSINLNL